MRYYSTIKIRKYFHLQQYEWISSTLFGVKIVERQMLYDLTHVWNLKRGEG